MNILLASILTCNVALLTVLVLVIRRVSRVYGEFKAFVSPSGDGKPSPLAQTADALASIFSRSITAQFKTSFMGMQSGAKRAEQAIEGDIAVDLASQASPVIGALLSGFPTVKKTLRRNPQLLDLVIASIAKRGKAMPVAPGSNGSNEQTEFKL